MYEEERNNMEYHANSHFRIDIGRDWKIQKKDDGAGNNAWKNVRPNVLNTRLILEVDSISSRDTLQICVIWN